MTTSRQTVIYFLRSAWRYHWYVIGLVVLMPIVTFFSTFIPPLIAASILDRLSQGNFIANDVWGSFGWNLVIYATATLLSGIIGWRLVVVLVWRLELFVQRDIAQHTFMHLMRQSASFHSNHFGGSLVSQAGKLQTSYVRFIDTSLFSLYVLILVFLFSAIMLWHRAPYFVLALFVFSVAFLLSAFFFTRNIRQLTSDEANAHNKQTGFLADSITNVLAVKSFAAFRQEKKHFARATEHTRKTGMALMKATTKRDMYFSAVTNTMGVFALVAGVISVVKFKANIGTVFLVLTYTGSMINSLKDFSKNALRNYNRAIGDSKAMIEILHTEPSVQDPARPEKPRITNGAITFKDMSFTHSDSREDDTLFSAFDLHIAAGERIGLVGHSGSGKTTLTRLLLRFADIDKGEVLIDGQNIAHITQEQLRSKIAYVPQEPLLFHRSLRENIAYGKPSASFAEIETAATRAHATDFIDKLPEGYETLVGERGVKLSGGQRQRIAIARAILKDAPILVLDEATSALDSESEQLIQKALWELMKNRTAIVIAHRLSTIQKMDRIVVLQDGAIVEQGTHKELLKKKGTYAELWTHQSGGFIEE